MSVLAAELVMRLFDSRTKAHVAHLRTRSYAQHVALDGYYNGVVDLADKFAEACQGRVGLLDYKPVAATPPIGIVEHLKALRRWIDENRGKVTPERELQNIIDEVLSLIDSTLYKLEFLA